MPQIAPYYNGNQRRHAARNAEVSKVRSGLVFGIRRRWWVVLQAQKIKFCQLKFVVKAWLTNQTFFKKLFFLVWGGAWRGTPQIAPYLRGNQRRHATRNATDLTLQPWKPKAGRASVLFSPPLFSKLQWESAVVMRGDGFRPFPPV